MSPLPYSRIALLVFGPRRLPRLGTRLGQAIRGFKRSFHDHETTPSAAIIRDEKELPSR
ncbi:MAG TPA: twin-arginine translocase TatA/TatE family subunit [Thermoanaerobaculia bacterium]